MDQRQFGQYKRRLQYQIMERVKTIENRDVQKKFYRSSLIRQIEAENDWRFTGEQTAELLRMAVYPDLRTEEKKERDEAFWGKVLGAIMTED